MNNKYKVWELYLMAFAATFGWMQGFIHTLWHGRFACKAFTVTGNISHAHMAGHCRGRDCVDRIIWRKKFPQGNDRW